MNQYTIFAIIVLGILLIAAIWAGIIKRKPYRSSRLLTPRRLMTGAIALAGLLFFLPYYFHEFRHATNLFTQCWDTFWSSVHHTVRLFVIDTDLAEMIAGDDFSLYRYAPLYSVAGTFLFISAPVMTAGVILSFFQNFAEYRKCFFHRRHDFYVFSELSEKSLALATDLLKKKKKSVVIFTDVFEENNEGSFELIEKAKELGAFTFKKDMTTLNLKFISRTSKITFFAIGEEESENIMQAFSLCKEDGIYANHKNVHLYIFSTTNEGEVLLSNLPRTNFIIHRVDSNRALVHRTLYDNGFSLFGSDDRPLPVEDGKRVIRAIIVGLGGHGTEMLRALPWFCQMAGFRIEIHAFDKDPRADKQFELLVPELMSPKNNGVYIPGEAQYKIVIHPGVSVDESTFTDELKKIIEEDGDPTYVFISMGNDARNVRTAVLLRQFFRQMHVKTDPLINAIVYDTKSNQILQKAHNWKWATIENDDPVLLEQERKKCEYGIEFIGDLSKIYSEDIIMNPELEKEALDTHLSYCGLENIPDPVLKREKELAATDNFYRYEYNYRSSMASALHRRLREHLEIAFFGKSAHELTEEERDELEKLEHNRWNAYMRSEGFVYSGSDEKSSRDDLAKMHNNLVPFDRLEEDIKRLDSIVGAAKGTKADKK